MKKQAITLSLLTLTALPAAAAIDCAVIPTCAELGYNDTVANCMDPENVLKCPFDKTIGKCLSNGAVVGQIGYFAKDPGEGWVLCDGRFYHKDKYPDLYTKIGTMFGGAGNVFRVPNYTSTYAHAFLKPATSTSGTLNKGCVPDIYGQLGLYGTEKKYTTTGGAFTTNSGAMLYGGDHSKGDGLIADFQASKFNSVYSFSCSAPRPNSYDVATYIYAGKTGTTTTTAASIASNCKQGDYYFTDGTCSSSGSVSGKTLKGKIDYASVSSSSVTISYVFGGGSSATFYAAEADCKNKGGGIAGWYELKNANISTSSVGPIYALSTSKTYWDSLIYSFTCTSTSPSSCSTGSLYGGFSSSSSNLFVSQTYYYYCQAYEYLK